MEKLSRAKELFRDVVDVNNYVPLASSEKVKVDLLNAIFDKEKMVLLAGEAGSGKSLILKKIYFSLKDNKKIFFIENPYVELNKILRLLNEFEIRGHHTILIDEAQLLTSEALENLRIYADRGNVTLVFATHNADIDKLLKKEQFKTRINHIIKLKKISFEETENFILTKLLRANLNDIASMFKKSNFKLIYKYTKGSLRATNQLMYKLFDVLEFFYNKNPSKIKNRLSNKYIHIAIMDLRMD